MAANHPVQSDQLNTPQWRNRYLDPSPFRPDATMTRFFDKLVGGYEVATQSLEGMEMYRERMRMREEKWKYLGHRGRMICQGVVD